MLSNSIIVALAVLGLAASVDSVCVSEDRYFLTMFLGTTSVPLHAIDNGPGAILMVAAPKDTAHGTPIYEAGAAPSTQINVEAPSGLFHLSVPDMGERYGSAAPVIGSEGYEWPHWYTTESNIWPQQTSGAQVFFACDATVNGQSYKALSWGLMGSDGSMPAGCAVTIVGKVYDVEVPCSK